MKFLQNSFLCVVAAWLLTAAYPTLAWWPLAWVALIPFFMVLDTKGWRAAMGFGWLFGFCFFFSTTGWLMHITLPGALLMAVYLAVYPALFGLSWVYFKKLPLIARVIVLASCWSFLELLRSTLFTGFGWVTLGHSQYQNIQLIQIADIIGVYGISFAVILVNLTVYETFNALIRQKDALGQVRQLQLIVIGLLLTALGYGGWIMSKAKFADSVKIAVVQPNIEQSIKWDPVYMPSIMTKTLDLTSQVAATGDPELIVWPETSLPGILSEQPAYQEQLQLKALDLSIPILIGTIRQNKQDYYNAAVLIGEDGEIKGHYDKIHLVPFGEFLPLRPILGWINEYIGLEDFTSGHEYTLFSAGKAKHPFGVVICFEDALNDIWRNFTLAGASFLVNITNDAWFMDTKEPYLHLQCAVFECVMNKRSLVRSANTGVSGFIDPLGRIIDLAHDKAGKRTFVSAHATAAIPVNTQLTFYTKYADVFTYLCLLCILAGVFMRKPTGNTRQEGRKYA